MSVEPRPFHYCSDCSSLPGLKRTALPGGMATSAPVRGLRPIPVLRGRTLKIPKPRSSMRSPCDRARFMLSKTVSTAISALVFVIPVLLTTSLIMSSLIKVPLLAGLVLLRIGNAPNEAPDTCGTGANFMIGLGLYPCQEQLSTPLPAAPAVWTRKPSGMHAVCSPPASPSRLCVHPTVQRTV